MLNWNDYLQDLEGVIGYNFAVYMYVNTACGYTIFFLFQEMGVPTFLTFGLP